MKKKVKWTIGIILILLITGYSFYSASKPLKVEVFQLQPQTVSQIFKEEGIVSAATERPIYSLINGKITVLDAKIGKQVKKGELLAQIDSKDLEYQLMQLKAQKNSLIGQEKKSYQEIIQQLGQLKGQLESIKGQEAQADNTQESTKIKQQQLIVDDTKRQLDTSRQEYNRIKQLYDSGSASKRELDLASDEVAQLENNLMQQEQVLKLIEEQMPGNIQYFSGLKSALQTQIDILEYEKSQNLNGNTATKQYYQGLIDSVTAQINQLEYQIQNSKITAPIDGIVKDMSIKEGAVVTTQTPLFTLISNNDFEINVYLLTEDVLNVKESMNVKLIQKRKNGDYEFSGVIKEIAPAAEEKVSALGLIQQKVKVTITPDGNAPELRSGYAVDVHFTTLEQHNKLAVPKTVLFPYENGDGLWVIQNNQAVMQKIQKGMETDELIVIESGLSSGDRVIKNPQLEGLEQGKKVK